MFKKNFRNYFFWMLDTAKGGPIKKHLKEIDFCVKNSTSAQAIKIKNKHLSQLLHHAVETTPFYNAYKKNSNISDLPVINKTIIQENFEGLQSSKYKNQKNYNASTSGSTGVPLILFQNASKRSRNLADTIFFFNETHFNVGNKLYKLEVCHEDNDKGKITAWLQNIIQFDVAHLTDERIEIFLELLKSDKNSKRTILGFSSALEMIAQYLDKNNIHIKNLRNISAIAYAEFLNPYTKSIFKKHLNISVLSRYSSQELGIIAQQTPESNTSFVINHASYHVELLQLDNDTPARPGEFGRIVITDLFNYAMPLIRYDTGDIGKLSTNNMELIQIEGRKMDLIYDSKGNIVSPFVVYTKFYKYYDLIKQYQFIQQGKKTYEVRLNLQGNDFQFVTELINGIKSDFGDDAEVTISYVDKIPPLASGKRKYVINNFKNKLQITDRI